MRIPARKAQTNLVSKECTGTRTVENGRSRSAKITGIDIWAYSQIGSLLLGLTIKPQSKYSESLQRLIILWGFSDERFTSISAIEKTERRSGDQINFQQECFCEAGKHGQDHADRSPVPAALRQTPQGTAQAQTRSSPSPFLLTYDANIQSRFCPIRPQRRIR